ncbi:MAG: hypothetical protein NC311_12235 [Muribaculaceae bacterium]|nr:hypothetical protein [Muribaculaceae bacterium]
MPTRWGTSFSTRWKRRAGERMAEKKVRGRFTIKLNETDPVHEKVICLLESQPPRTKAQLMVNALLHYMNCPAATDGTESAINRAFIEVIVREVLKQQGVDKLPDAAQTAEQSWQSQKTDHTAQSKGGMPTADTEKNNETFSLVADALSAFRGG